MFLTLTLTLNHTPVYIFHIKRMIQNDVKITLQGKGKFKITASNLQLKFFCVVGLHVVLVFVIN